jgi:clan AA aspartic protease (TIGR02281 family)
MRVSSTIATLALTAAGGFFLLTAGVQASADAVAPEYNTPIYSQALSVDRAVDGRLYMTVEINGERVRVLVDTAASRSVLRVEDAQAAQIQSSGVTRLRTAGGVVEAEQGVAAQINVDGHIVSDHRVIISREVPVSLLGMDVLRTLDGVHIAL